MTVESELVLVEFGEAVRSLVHFARSDACQDTYVALIDRVSQIPPDEARALLATAVIVLDEVWP